MFLCLRQRNYKQIPSRLINKKNAAINNHINPSYPGISALHVHCWTLPTKGRGIHRIAGTLALDPWDDEARIAVTLDF